MLADWSVLLSVSAPLRCSLSQVDGESGVEVNRRAGDVANNGNIYLDALRLLPPRNSLFFSCFVDIVPFHGGFTTLRLESRILGNANNCPAKFGSSVAPPAMRLIAYLRAELAEVPVACVWPFVGVL